MLRLKPFEVLKPQTCAEAARMLAAQDKPARVVSGGTDLVPNLKLAHGRPEVLVSLQGVGGLRAIEVHGDTLKIGARVTLHEVATHPLVREHVRALADAVGRIASPQVRHMGTLAGNICLDTRCRYINQSELFRKALGGCMKSHGDQCHVVPGGKNCVAANSSDSVPVLIALGATLDIVGPDSTRETPIDTLYGKDGTDHVELAPSEVITTVQIPIPKSHTRLAYRKWAVRKSIDFPLVSVATRLDLAEGDPTTIDGGVIVVNALGPKPRIIDLSKLQGRKLDESLAADLESLVFKRCKPLPNIPYEPGYRRRRLGVEVKRAVRSFFTEAPRD